MALLEIRFLLTKLILICVIVIWYFPAGYSGEDDYFSAVAGLEKLLKTEATLLIELEKYVAEATEHIDALKSEMENIRAEHLLAEQDLENYISHPLNSYRLIKRLQNDWSTFQKSIQDDVSAKNFLAAMGNHRQNLSFPGQSDVYYAALGLVRLQDTYRLDVAQLASGILNGVKIGSSMSWQDCFLLGHQLYEMRNFNHTILWLKQSMKILSLQDYNRDPISLDFMSMVAGYHQEMGDFESALELVNYILNIDPTRKEAQETKAYLEEVIAKGVKMGLMHEIVQQFDYHQTNEFKLYEKVCRSEVRMSPTQQRPLRCKYHTNNVAYRLLQPFKMEELFLEPYVVQFHDVIRHKEMDTVKQLATPSMARSKVRSFNGTNEVVANYRTSKTAWFEYQTHSYMQQMRQHVSDLSGLDTLSAEELQVANYGIGGHYEPHWDFFADHDSCGELGNRIATAIYYISDVEEGGGTAFPFLRLLVKPTRGSVLFWYNLHQSEEPDYRTRHAACPVLRGSKWIANVWIRARGQEFLRPCGLKPDHEISLKFKDFD